MTYRQLIRTLEIFAKYDGGLDTECINMYAEHDEHGIKSNAKNWASKDVRELISLGNLLGYDSVNGSLDNEEITKRENFQKNPMTELSDEEVLELWEKCERGVFKYE